jgi:uncharacterized membrane protein YqhA
MRRILRHKGADASIVNRGDGGNEMRGGITSNSLHLISRVKLLFSEEMKAMTSILFRFISSTRYLIILPILGLAITSALLFIVGGYRLLASLYEAIFNVSYVGERFPVVQIVEFVHLFLIGTVLWITAVGLYQLFIRKIPMPDWLQVNDIEDLETDLIGITVVVLAVNFLSITFASSINLMEYGIEIAFPIAALGFTFMCEGERTIVTR